jgi:hypothetical protein
MDWKIMKEVSNLYNDDKIKECADLIVSNLQDIYEYDMDFISTCVELTPASFILCQEQYKKIYLYFDKMESANIRCAIRMARLGQLIEQYGD